MTLQKVTEQAAEGIAAKAIEGLAAIEAACKRIFHRTMRRFFAPHGGEIGRVSMKVIDRFSTPAVPAQELDFGAMVHARIMERERMVEEMAERRRAPEPRQAERVADRDDDSWGLGHER